MYDRVFYAACFVLLLGLSGLVSADSYWDNDNGNNLWSNAANWDPDGLPDSDDVVHIELSADTDSAMITTGTNALCDWLWVGCDDPYGALLMITGGSLTQSGDSVTMIGSSYKGRLGIYGGSTYLKQLQLGISGGNGELNISNGSLNMDGWIYVGKNNLGVGTINMTGGDVDAVGQDIIAGDLAGSNGVINISDGTISTSQLKVGNSGNGELNISSNGLVQASWQITVGLDTGTGTINITGGDLISDHHFVVGNSSSSSGVIDISGGTLTVDQSRVGYYGEGELNISSNGSVDAGWEMIVGAGSGTGTVNMTGGEMTVDEWLIVGNSTGDGIINISDGVIETGQLKICSSTGSGQVNMEGGEFIVWYLHPIGGDSGGTGTLNIDEGTFKIPDAGLNISDNGYVDINEGKLCFFSWTEGDAQAIVNNYIFKGLLTGYNGTGGILAEFDEPNFLMWVTGTPDKQPPPYSYWDNEAVSDNLWSTDENWYPDSLPGDATIVNITTCSDNGALITNGIDAKCSWLWLHSDPYYCESDPCNAWGAVLTMTGGTLTSQGDTQITIGDDDSENRGAGTFNMSGGIADFGTNMHIGEAGNGQLNLSGNANINVGYCTVISNADGNGTLNVDGGNFVCEWMALGYGSGTGIINLSDGVITVSDTLEPEPVGGSAGYCEINITGGTLDVGWQMKAAENGTANINLDGGLLKLGHGLNLDADTHMDITGSGELRFKGGGDPEKGEPLELVDGYAADGYLTAYGGSGTIFREYNDVLEATIVTAGLPTNKAHSPSPSDGAIDRDYTVNLSWFPGTGAQSHDVYFGTDFDDVNEASDPDIPPGHGNQSQTTYELGELALGQTYYWRIDEQPTNIKGDMWSFTVISCMSVDDFESYDGSSITSNWSKAGTAYIALADIPRHGDEGVDNQAIKVNYSNQDSPNYAEIIFTYDDANDWAAKDIQSLQIAFTGLSENDAEQIFIALEDTATIYSELVEYDGGTDKLQKQWLDWPVWRIPVADLVGDSGISLNSIKKIHIYIGKTDGSGLKGSGTVYFDDIKICVSMCVPEYVDGDFDSDCDVDSDDIEIMGQGWLEKQYIVGAQAPSTPVVCYEFDESSGITAYDSSGHGYNATMSDGQPHWSTGGVDGSRCIRFNGTFGALVPSSAFTGISSEITVSVWINGDVDEQPQSDSGNIFHFSGDDGASLQAMIPTAETDIFCHSHGDSLIWLPESVDAWEGQWNHYALVKDAVEKTMSLYFNGILVKQVTDNDANSLPSGLQGGDPDYIGSRNGQTFHSYIGKLDKFKMYDYALSQAEIVYLAGLGSVQQLVLSPADINSDDEVNFEDFAKAALLWIEGEILWP